VRSAISGDVAITAAFVDGMASGEITQRNRFLTATGGAAASDFANVTLAPVAISDGRTVGRGDTSGGELVQTNVTPEGGSIEGNWLMSFSGQNATSAGGIVFIDHDYVQGGGGITTDFAEFGAFAVTR